MKTLVYADNCSQLSEKFMMELQLSGVPANNLAVNNTLPSSNSESCSSTDLPPEFFYLQNDEGETQLHISIILENIRVSAYLISIAPNPSYLDVVTDECYTALHYAALTGQAETVRNLVLAGANTQIRTIKGDTALHLAVQKGHMECVKALVQPLSLMEKDDLAKSNIPLPQIPACLDARNYVGVYPIHIAAKRNDVQMVHHLLLAGANVNAQEGLAGRTPLHIAMEHDSADVVHYLAQIPTTLFATTYGGDAAYQFALQCAPHYADALLRYGAEPVIRALDDDSSSDGSCSDGDYEAYMGFTKSYSNVCNNATYVRLSVK